MVCGGVGGVGGVTAGGSRFTDVDVDVGVGALPTRDRPRPTVGHREAVETLGRHRRIVNNIPLGRRCGCETAETAAPAGRNRTAGLAKPDLRNRRTLVTNP
ncbi:hypothetical protein GCM10027570_16770 [Streptomonospora sediminis]